MKRTVQTFNPQPSIPPVATPSDAELALRSTGLTPRGTLRPAEKQGLISTVYIGDTIEEGQVAIKVNSDLTFGVSYACEKVCAERARGEGIPCPEVLSSGCTDSAAFLVTRRVEARNGRFASSEQVESIFRKLGEWASIINRIPVVGFGGGVSDLASPGEDSHVGTSAPPRLN